MMPFENWPLPVWAETEDVRIGWRMGGEEWGETVVGIEDKWLNLINKNK